MDGYASQPKSSYVSFRIMETRKDRLSHPYKPKLHDYVKYYRGGITHEGWVYYVGEDYISIELGVKDKPSCRYTRDELHKKTHILLVCPSWDWDKLEYVKSRRDFHDDRPYRD